METVKGSPMTTDQSQATTVIRLAPSEWVATAAFVAALLVTTAPDYGFIEQNISRTRELTTSYIVIGIALLAAPWRLWDRTLRIVVSVLGVSIVVGFLVWQAQESSAIAANYWPQWLLPLAMLLLGLAYGQRLWWLWRGVLIVYAVVIGVIQLWMLAVNWQASGDTAGMDNFYGSRPLGADLAFMMVVAVVMALTEPGLGARGRNLVASFLGISVVVAQHRSAWVALLVVLVLLSIRYVIRREGIARWWGVPAIGAFFVAAATLPFLLPATLLPGESPQGTSLPDSFEAAGTLSWRFDMWESRLERARSLPEWLFGGVFGGTPVWGPESDVMNPALTGHSMYVDLLSMLGVVGLLSFVVLTCRAVWKTSNRFGEMPIIVWSALSFGIFYAWPPWVWGLLGVALVPQARGSTAPD